MVTTTSESAPRAGTAALFAAVLAGAVVLLVPWEPPSYLGETDLSWQLVLHDAWATGVHFGDQLVFNYGPYGFIYCGYDPRTYVTGLFLWLLLAGALAAGLWEIGRRSFRSLWLAAAFVLLIADIVAIDFDLWGPTNNVLFITLAIVLVRLHALHRGGWAEHLVAVALGLAALVKFSFFTAAAGMFAVVAIGELLRRRVAWTAATFAASLMGFWLLARQPLSLLPRFIRHSAEVGAGYGEAMALRFPYVSDQFELALFLVLAAAFLFRIAGSSWREAAAMLPILFVVFKIGFTRQDGHDVDAASLVALAVLIALPERLLRGDRSQRAAWSVLALAATWLFSMSLTTRDRPDVHLQLAITVRKRVVQLAHVVAHGTDRLQRQRAELLGNYRASLDHRPVGKTFDIYPSADGVLLAWQLPPARRPVFQATSAYSEPLLEMNAAHLRGDSAPATILFGVSPLDKRFPTLEDSASWREILRRYEPVERDGQFEVLGRRGSPIALPVRARSVVSVPFEQPLTVPDPGGDLLFARIDYRYTAAGRLTRLAYITPPLFATVRVAGEKPRRYRIVPANVRVGFLLSPLVRTTDDFALLLSAKRERLPRVLSVELERPAFPWMFEPQVGVAFERVSYQ